MKHLSKLCYNEAQEFYEACVPFSYSKYFKVRCWLKQIFAWFHTNNNTYTRSYKWKCVCFFSSFLVLCVCVCACEVCICVSYFCKRRTCQWTRCRFWSSLSAIVIASPAPGRGCLVPSTRVAFLIFVVNVIFASVTCVQLNILFASHLCWRSDLSMLISLRTRQLNMKQHEWVLVVPWLIQLWLKKKTKSQDIWIQYDENAKLLRAHN